MDKIEINIKCDFKRLSHSVQALLEDVLWAKLLTAVVLIFTLAACSKATFQSDSAVADFISPAAVNPPTTQPLTANSISLLTKVNVSLPISIQSILSANTVPSGQTLKLSSVGLPSMGQFSLSGTEYQFISAVSGDATVNYTIQNSDGATAVGIINIKVLDVASVTGAFYAANETGQFYVLDTSSGALKTSLKSTYLGTSIGFNDLAIDSKGIMYGKDPANNVYIVDGGTGVATMYLPTIVPDGAHALGLTILSNGKFVTAMKSVSGAYSIVIIDPKTKSRSTLVPESKGYDMNGGDIKLLPDGYLYWTVTNLSSTLCKTHTGNGNQAIVKVNPSSGATQEVVCLSVNDVFGLGFANKKLYGFSGAGDLIQVDLTSGLTQLINATGNFFAGAAANPALW